MKKATLVVIAAVVVAALVLVLVLSLFRVDPSTRALLDQPDRTVSVETAAGEMVSLDVKFALDGEARADAFKGVDPEVVAEHVLYIEYPFPATLAHRTEGLETPVDMIFFDATGASMGLFTARPEDAAGYRPKDPYQYVLMASEGRFAEMGIDERSSLRLTLL